MFPGGTSPLQSNRSMLPSLGVYSALTIALSKRSRRYLSSSSLNSVEATWWRPHECHSTYRKVPMSIENLLFRSDLISPHWSSSFAPVAEFCILWRFSKMFLVNRIFINEVINLVFQGILKEVFYVHCTLGPTTFDQLVTLSVVILRRVEIGFGFGEITVWLNWLTLLRRRFFFPCLASMTAAVTNVVFWATMFGHTFCVFGRRRGEGCLIGTDKL